jgi:hypothetical protein
MKETYSFMVTVAKRDDLEHPATAKDAASLIGYLLEKDAYLDVIDVRGVVNAY